MSETITLQQGFDGYLGTEDATVRLWEEGRNVGWQPYLQIHVGNDPGEEMRSRVFLRFDLNGAIPTGRELSVARLELFELPLEAENGHPEAVSLHELNVKPVEGEVSGALFAEGKPWAVPLGKEGIDYGATVVAGHGLHPPLDAGGGWIELEVSRSVEKWVKSPADNKGWLFMADPESASSRNLDVRFCSAQQEENKICRPRLVLLLR